MRSKTSYQSTATHSQLSIYEATVQGREGVCYVHAAWGKAQLYKDKHSGRQVGVNAPHMCFRLTKW